MGKSKVDRTEAEWEAMHQRAVEAARVANATEPRAVAARYDRHAGRVVVELQGGCVFMFPPALAEGLAGAAEEDLAVVEVYPDGEGLHWPRLDVDVGVPNLLVGLFGSETWMASVRAAFARSGGKVRSAAKTRAVRENGKKGGRPKKTAQA